MCTPCAGLCKQLGVLSVLTFDMWSYPTQIVDKDISSSESPVCVHTTGGCFDTGRDSAKWKTLTSAFLHFLCWHSTEGVVRCCITL